MLGTEVMPRRLDSSLRFIELKALCQRVFLEKIMLGSTVVIMGRGDSIPHRDSLT